MNNIPQVQDILPIRNVISSESLLWMALGVTFLVTVIFAATLVYHWQEYEVNQSRRRIFIWLYFSVTVVLLAVAISGVVIYLYF